MGRENSNISFSQRQLRVGELVKQSLGQIFLRGEAKVPNFETKNNMSPNIRDQKNLKLVKNIVFFW